MATSYETHHSTRRVFGINADEGTADNVLDEVADLFQNDQNLGEHRDEENEIREEPVDDILPPPIEARDICVTDLLQSTDHLFAEVTDKESVTVKDVYVSLEAEYGVTLDRKMKQKVRERLVTLITQHNQDETMADEQDEDAVNVSDVGEVEDDDDASVSTREEEEEDLPSSQRQRSSKQRRKSLTQAAKVKVAAARILAQQQRKKRLQELQVRNEELQAMQSQQDQERANKIAEKFDTNTIEMKQQRTLQRWGLLEKLDFKRRQVLQQDDPVPLETDPPPGEQESAEEESDMELEIEGGEPNKLQARFIKPGVLSVLDRADRKLLPPNKTKHTSPGRSRTALRHQLLAKQRKMGNLWLARELGYQNEQDHVRDCMQVHREKRTAILAREAKRLAENERQKQRMLQMEDDIDENMEETHYNGDSLEEEEEDEEQALANTLEEEKEWEPHDSSEIEDDSVLNGDNREVQYHDEDEDNNSRNESEETEPRQESRTEIQATSPVLAGNSPFQDFRSSDPSNDQGNSAIQLFESEEPMLVKNNVELDADEATKTSSSEGIGSAAPEHDGIRSSNAPIKNLEDEAENKIAEVVEDEATKEGPKGPRNSAWKALLEKEKQRLKQKRKGDFVEEEADEEEEEEVAGLEDFGFKVIKKKNDDDNEEDVDYDEDDLEHVVDDLSDNEGDEEAGNMARLAMQRREEKDRQKEMLRLMREGYDGRRGGIATGGVGARGVHRFDQLVAADNREDAKLLGLLNDDEIDSDADEKEGDADEEEDEAALLDKILKDRFLHRSSVELEENFSGDEEEDEAGEGDDVAKDSDDEEEKEQERLAKRLEKRARMQRLLETYGEEEEFTQSRLIEEDVTLKQELQKMKNGLQRKRGRLARDVDSRKKSKSNGGSAFASVGGSLALALQASRRHSSTFLRGDSGTSSEVSSSLPKNVAFGHVVFRTESQSSRFSSSSRASKSSTGPLPRGPASSSLWSRAEAGSQQKQRL